MDQGRKINLNKKRKQFTNPFLIKIPYICFNMIYKKCKGGLIQLAMYNMNLRYLESPGTIMATSLLGNIFEDECFHFF